MGIKVRMINDLLLADMLESNKKINYEGFYKEDLIRMVEILRKKYKELKIKYEGGKEYEN